MVKFLKAHFAPHLLVVIMFGVIGYLVTLALDIRHLKEDVEVIRCGLNPKQTKYLHASNIPLKGSQAEKTDFIRSPSSTVIGTYWL